VTCQRPFGAVLKLTLSSYRQEKEMAQISSFGDKRQVLFRQRFTRLWRANKPLNPERRTLNLTLGMLPGIRMVGLDKKFVWRLYFC